MFEFPDVMKELVGEISDDSSLNVGLSKIQRRAQEFASPATATLAGIALYEPAREHFERRLDEIWEETKLPDEVDEIIVGGGLHAAIYASVRVAEGYPPPLVLERGRVGGTFAVSRRPSFFLNMANRPGPLGIPGGRGSLGVLPRAPIQPADLSAEDYQRNTDLAYAVRSALMMNARVKSGEEVFGITNTNKELGVILAEGDTIRVKRRVLVATGLGAPKTLWDTDRDDPRLLTFPTFMARMDEDYPLKDMKRVAVIGAGDSGKTVIEALTGQGPQTGMSVASMDFVEQIDWFGVPGECTTRNGWTSTARSRYKRIGRLLPLGLMATGARVQPRGRAEYVRVGYDAVYVNEQPYDCVVCCIGYSSDRPLLPAGAPSTFSVGGRRVGRRYREAYLIGPAADLSVSSSETLTNIPENSVALFRYADRTAALAASFRDRKSVAVSVAIEVNPVGGVVDFDTKRFSGGLLTYKGQAVVDKNGNSLFVGMRVVTDTNVTGTVGGIATKLSSGRRTLKTIKVGLLDTEINEQRVPGGYLLDDDTPVYGASPSVLEILALPKFPKFPMPGAFIPDAKKAAYKKAARAAEKALQRDYLKLPNRSFMRDSKQQKLYVGAVVDVGAGIQSEVVRRGPGSTTRVVVSRKGVRRSIVRSVLARDLTIIES